MNLQNAKLGEQYLCYLNTYGEITSVVYEQTIVSTILAIPTTTASTSQNQLLLGWKKECRPNNASPRSGIGNLNTDWSWARKQEEYIYSLKVDRVAIRIHSKVPGTDSNLDGFSCKECRNFSQFAESNQLDGSFVCWSCRSFR